MTDLLNISKTTVKYAEKRNLSVSLIDAAFEDNSKENERYYLGIADTNEDICDDMVVYVVDAETGIASFYGNVYLPESIKEELPGTIQNQQHLRQVLDFIGSEFINRDA